MLNYLLSSMSWKDTANKAESKVGMKRIKEELLKWICKEYATNSFLDKHSLKEEAFRLMRIYGTNGVVHNLPSKVFSTSR